MKNLKKINEAVGTILERRASAETLLKAVVKGDTTEVEGIALSKQMAQGFLDWLQYSTYGKRFGALPFYKLFSASFNWGLDRYVKGANTEVKGEFKELKAKAKSMKESSGGEMFVLYGLTLSDKMSAWHYTDRSYDRNQDKSIYRFLDTKIAYIFVIKKNFWITNINIFVIQHKKLHPNCSS